MVVISTHIVVYLLFLDKRSFLKTFKFGIQKPQTRGVSKMTEEFQDGILKLSSVISYGEFEDTLKEALSLTLQKVTDVLVYIPSQDGQNLVSTCGMLHTLPKEGILGECINQRQRIIQEQGLPSSDPVCGLLNTVPTVKKKKVICSPVIDSESDKIQAVLLAICDAPSKEDLNNLTYLEKQTIVCCKRLKRTAQLEDTSNQCSSLRNEHLNNNSSILKLCADLYDHDAASLQIKVIKYLTEQTQSETGFLLLIDRSHREMVCQVIGNKALQEEIRLPLKDSPFTQSIETGSPIKLADIEKDQLKKIEQLLQLTITTFICVPVKRKATEETMALACLVNKQGASFTDSDIESVQYCFKYTATVLHSTLALQTETLLKNQTQALLQVAKNLFTHLDDLTVLLREIMQEARNLTQAERCSVFLVEEETKELVAKVFDSDVQDHHLQTEVRIPLAEGIAGHVATTGEILNIDDAYAHPLFYRGVDESTGFKTRNILCFPIKDENDEVIGVAQLCNKIKAMGFTSFDEDVAQAFSVYCCISIMHTLMYKTVRDSQHRSKLSNELMMYHMQIDPSNVRKFCEAVIPPAAKIDYNFCTFAYAPRCTPYVDTPLAVLAMFEDMGFISKFRIRKDTLVRFVLMVRRGYRDPPYHNWTHAFAVAHFCYLMFKNDKLQNYLDDLEVLSLFVACLCHDIDHRGTTNSYQVASDSVLAALYSSEGSVLERHHFAQTMCILNTEGCNIFETLDRSSYEKILDLIRDNILATDIGTHLRIIPDLEKMAKEGYDKNQKHQKHLLLSLLMTSCDLSDQTKTWKIIKQVAELIYQEFFSQGDMEKELGKAPIAMMDRDSACIPELQIGFLDGIALPVFKLVDQLFPDTTHILDVVEHNKQNWVRMNEKANELKLKNNSFDVLQLPLEDADDVKMESSA